MFSYTQAGAVAGKRLRVAKTNPYQNQQGQWVSQTGVGDLNLAYSYNNEGKPTQIVYPYDAASGISPTYNYTYDAMARLNGMTGTDNGVVSNVSYGPANELLSINYYGATETRTYNSLLQLTNISATVQGGTGINLTYNYTAGANNGKIVSMTDALSGETVAYQYDSLNRLISAAGSGWTQTQSYDGFGNLTGRVGTGTAQSTTMSTPADAATNRLSGYSYDANGNLLSTGNVYDAENRLGFANMAGGMVEYFYDAQNKRIWQGTCTAGGNCQQGVVNTDTITLFGADGRQIATYQWSAPWNNTQTQVAIPFQASARRAYFGGKLVAQSQSGVMLSAVQDRLGSVGKYYPYGEERNSPQLPNDQVKFATYTRDSGTGLDYADQRYYASVLGRFMTPDPSRSSAGPGEPGSWNRYSYTRGDPTNRFDPRGMEDGEPDPCIVLGFDQCFYPLGNPPPDPNYTPPPPPVAPYVGLTDQWEQRGAVRGSTNFAQAREDLTQFKYTIGQLFAGPQSESCEKDLKALDLTDAQVSQAAYQVNILDGLTAISGTYAQNIWANSPAYQANVTVFGNINLVQYMTLVSPNAAAVAQANGSNIYINASWINGMSGLDQEALLLHELLHNITGLTDDAIQTRLGIDVTVFAQNIADKLKADCFK